MTISNAKIILGCTIVLIIFLSGSMYFMWKHLDALTHSPLTYGAEKTAELSNADDLICNCRLVGGEVAPNQDRSFSFNSTNIWTKDSQSNDPSLTHLNLSR